MARNILLSGPAGAAKSQEARERLRASGEPTIAADFSAIAAGLLLLERDAEGLYPVRPAWSLPITEYTRRAVITGARQRDISVVVTNSDGDLGRREAMLELLGPDSEEVVIDPGERTIRARLSNRRTGKLSRDCEKAMGRWYLRLGGRGGGRRR